MDTREHIQLVLAKNGIPTSEDVAAANELISLIESTTYASGLFLFLLRRCGANVNKRIHNLNISIQNTEFLDGFQFALQTYVPMSDIQAEFPDADREMILGAYKNAVPPFANVWGDLVRMITDITVNELDTEDISSSKVTYRTLSVHANALAQSRFLKNLVNDRLIPMGF